MVKSILSDDWEKRSSGWSLKKALNDDCKKYQGMIGEKMQGWVQKWSGVGMGPIAWSDF